MTTSVRDTKIQPVRSSQYPHIPLPEDPSLYYPPIYAWFPSGVFPSGFPTKPLYTLLLSPTRATCPAHLILLDFITRTILGEQYRSFSSSLCNFLHSPLTSTLLGTNIPNVPLSKHPQPTLLSQRKRPSFTHIQNRQNYSSVYLNL